MAVLISRKDQNYPKIFVKWIDEGVDEFIHQHDIPELKGITEVSYQIGWLSLSEGIKRSLSIKVEFDILIEDSDAQIEMISHLDNIEGYDLYVVLEDRELKLKEIFRGKNILFDKIFANEDIVRCSLRLISE